MMTRQRLTFWMVALPLLSLFGREDAQYHLFDRIREANHVVGIPKAAFQRTRAEDGGTI